MYVLNGRSVSEADFLADELAFEAGQTTYIRPVYRNGWFVGFCVYVNCEAVGKVFRDYKLAAQLLDQIRSGELS
jgi:hypothetical protein